MNFSVASSELQKALSIASGAIGSGSVVYILEDFLFDIDGDQLTISATNMEVSITTTINIQGSESVRLAIPGKILQDTLKALPAQPVNFDIDEEHQVVELESSFGKYKMAYDKTDDYPVISKPDTEDKLTIPADILQKAISNSLFAISNDDMRVAMTGLFTQIDFDKVTFVATDAHKLVKYTYNGVNGNFSSDFIIPKKALALLKTILPHSGDVSVSFDRSFAFFSWGNTRLNCRLIDAQFPDYNVVIPVNNPFKMHVNREALLSSMRRISIFANKTTNQVALSIADKSLTISAKDLDFSNEATEQLTCEYDGEPMSIGFNARFVVEMLSVLESDEITMLLADPGKAGLVIPSDMEDNEDLLMLVMPVMIPNG